MIKTILGTIILLLGSKYALAADEVPSHFLRIPQGSFYSPYVILVDKTQRKTFVWKSTNDLPQKVAEFVSDQGKNDGDKKLLGDHKTPEGVYFFQQKYEGEFLDYNLYGVRAFTTDYPNLFDQRDGKTGSGIWLHGIPDSESLERGSRGCVVVRNKSILEISQFITLGRTPIVITNQIDYAKPDNLKSMQSKIENFVDQWRMAWNSRDLDKYMSFYSESEFESQRMNWSKWKDFKSGLNARYNEIGVELSSPFVLMYKNEVVVRFLQKYHSDQHEDFGEKTLFIKMENGSPKIIAENWVNMISDENALAQFESEMLKQRKVSSAESSQSSLQN